jgi:hypothetical protein
MRALVCVALLAAACVRGGFGIDARDGDGSGREARPNADGPRRERPGDVAGSDAERDAPARDWKDRDRGPGTDAPAGVTWKKITAPFTGKTLLGLWGNSSDSLVAVGRGCLFATWGALSGWSLIGAPGCTEDLHDVWGSGGVYWAVGSSGRILRVTTQPLTSTLEPTGTKAALHAIAGRSTSELRVVGEGTILRRSGNTWVADQAGVLPAHDLRAVWLGASSEAALGAAGAFYARPVNTATPWKPVTSYWTLLAVAVGSSDAIAVGEQGAVVRFDGSSALNHPVGGIPTSVSLHHVWASGTGHFVAVGASGHGCADTATPGGAGVAYHFSAASAASTPALPASTPALCAVWGAGWDDVFAVGEGGTVLRYSR